MGRNAATNYEASGLNAAESFGDGSIDLGLGGSYSSSYGSDSCLTVDLCPDLLFAALALAAAAAFVFVYMAITVKGRRRRSLDFQRNYSFYLKGDLITFVNYGMCVICLEWHAAIRFVCMY